MVMERSREARRSNMAAANGLSRRRRRSTSLRESHVVEEDVQMELQATVRLRDRANKREYSNHHKIQNKRRRGDSEEESAEESVADDEDFEIEEKRVAHTISYNTNSFSTSVLNQSKRKNLPPAKFVKQAPALETADELIGALVPRKARSASVKKSHEKQDQNASSTSPASRSAEANNSPSSSNVSVRKKMKPNGPNTRLPKVVKCSTSSSAQQEDIEFEIAEVLFGLTKQSHNSKMVDGDNIQKLESKDVKAISQDTESSVSVPASDLLPDALKKEKVEAGNSSNPVCNGSVSSSIKIESKMETSASHEVDAPKVASMIVEPQEEITEQGDSKLSNEGSASADGPVTEKKSISAKEESSTCVKMDVDFQDSTVTKATSIVLENESIKEEKFKIDLMAPPPMVSSAEMGGFNDFASDPSFEPKYVKMKSFVKDEEKTERFLKKEPAVEEVEEKKIETIGEKRQLKIDLEKPNQDNGKDNSVQLLQQHLQTKSTIAKVEKTESSSVPLKNSIAGWPNALQPLGYMPPLQTITSTMDGITRSSTAQQTPPFMLSQPRPKRCDTHCYIARNIYLNQQLAKMNHFWPAGAGSTPLHGAKPNNPNAMPSTENIIHGNPLQGSFPRLNLNSEQDKGQAVASFPNPSREDKSSEGVNFMGSAQKKQLLLQQAPPPAPAGNLLHAPAFIFPVSQQQSVVTAGANQHGPSKSAATSTKSASVSGNSTAALPASSMSLPAIAAAVSYNFPNLAGNETPYLTILQNNGYPFPIPTPFGTAPAIRGSHAQALPFFNGSFYSSQIFHPSQPQHQQPHSQPLMQAAHHSSASSSSHKQLHSQQPKGVPVSGNNFVSSMSMQSQQTQKQHVSSSNQNRKPEAEMSGENTPSVADSQLSHNQTSVYGQNFSVPLQPLNFALMPSPAVGGGSAGGTHSEKQQQLQQKSSKGGVEFTPQSFAMSFASFIGSDSPSNLNFSSLQHNPAIFQSLPDVARQGYQVLPASQAAPQKNHQITDMKTGGGSSNHDEGKKPGLGKSSATNAQTLFFDDSARTLNFVSSPITGNWPSRSITSTATTTNCPIAANSQNFQQQHPLQQQMLKQQQQAAARTKAQTTNCVPSSSIAAKLSVQSNNSSQSSQWTNSARNPTNQVPPNSLASSSASNIKNAGSNISFERHSKSGLAPQGQQIPTSNQSPTSGGKGGSSLPALQSQQTENTSASTGQKSSPVCGRNVPSILSTCPSHLSELEY